MFFWAPSITASPELAPRSSREPRGAVHHRQEQTYAAQDQAAYDQRLAAQQAAPDAAAPAELDYAAELEQLAQLKAQGIITEEEFEAKKKQIVGI